jgi:hypothetical protein
MSVARPAWLLTLALLACTEPVLIPDPDRRDRDKDTETERPLPINCETCKSCDLAQDCGRNEACLRGLCIPIVCGDGIVAGPEECEDNNDDDRDFCIRCRWASCGDGKLSAHEECEIGLGGGRRAWTSATCHRVSCERALYNPCVNDLDCPGLSHCLHGLCSPSAHGSCPQIPEFDAEEILGVCYLRCNEDGACPPRLTCATDGHCLTDEDDAVSTDLNEYHR